MSPLFTYMEDAARYMDDLFVFIYALKVGWRWEGKELCWWEEWAEEDQESGKNDLESSCEIFRVSMNQVYDFLNFTIESEMNVRDRRLPTLDFKSWVDERNLILYTFFEKPTSSNQMIHRESALPENIKMQTLNWEVVRRMQNTSELLPIEEREAVLDDLSQKLANSGYNLNKTRQILVGGLSGYEKRVRRS